MSLKPDVTYDAHALVWEVPKALCRRWGSLRSLGAWDSGTPSAAMQLQLGRGTLLSPWKAGTACEGSRYFIPWAGEGTWQARCSRKGRHWGLR